MFKVNKLTNYSEVKFVNLAQVSKQLECPICSNFYCYPLRLSCGHTFCTECYKGLQSSVNQQQQFKCALCRETVDLRYVAEDKIAKNLMDEQLVYCLNKSKFCLWQGSLRDLETHLDNCKFKEHDEMSQNLIMKFDNSVQETAKNSNLNMTISNQTFVEEKFQENLNRNVGEQLIVRLLNKNKDIAQSIARSLSTTQENSRATNVTQKRSVEEKTNINNSYETEDEQEEEEKKKNMGDLDIDNLDDVFQMFDDEKSDTKEILKPGGNKEEEKPLTKKPSQRGGRRKSKQKSKEEDGSEDEYNPAPQQRKRGNKKRQYVGDIPVSEYQDFELQQKIKMFELYGIDLDQVE